MNTSVIHFGSSFGRAPVRGSGYSFAPTLELPKGLKQAVDFAVDPMRLLSERDEQVISRRSVTLAAPLIERIQLSADAVLHGAQVIAAASSALVRQEAARLALLFAERGLELNADPDEVVMPSVLHAPSGAVQFEWHRKGVDLEISVLPSGRIAGYVECEGQEPREVDLSAGMWEIESELNTVLPR